MTQRLFTPKFIVSLPHHRNRFDLKDTAGGAEGERAGVGGEIGAGAVTFAAGNSTIGHGTLFVAAADLNGDGHPDLIVSNTQSSTVSVLLGNGNGTFGIQQTFATGMGAAVFATGDLNGDGKLDLVVANENDSTASVLLGNGDGTFQTQATLAIGFSFFVTLADVNGDGRLDIVANDDGNDAVSVLLGNGNGTFAARQTFSAGNNPQSIAVADMNGDGIPDLIVANANDDTVGVLLGNGNGTFAAQQSFATATGSRPYSVTVSDVNGDGKPDVVVTNSGNVTVSLLHPDQSTSLTGQAYIVNTPSVNAAAVTLTAAPPAAVAGSAIVLTATVASSTATGPAPTGTVTFFDGATSIGTAALAGGIATLTTSSLSVGTHPITALYSGDSANGANAAAALNVIVLNQKANAVLNITGATSPFDINPHSATATATGVAGENLNSLLHIIYQNTADNSVSAAAPVQPGSYKVLAAFDGNSTYNPVASFDTGQTIVIGPKSVLQSIPSGKLPTITLVAGGKIRPIALTLKLTNTLATLFTGNVTINVTLSASPTGTSGDPIVGTLTRRNVKIKGSKTAPFGAVFIRSLPAGLTGTLYFIAKLTDSTGATNVVAFPGSIVAAAPFVDLAALGVAPPPKAHLGKKVAVVVTLMQNGNIPLVGSVPAELFLSLNGTLTGAIDLGPAAGRVSLQPGKKGVLHLTATIPSNTPANSYHVIAKIDPNNTLNDTSTGNNVMSSVKTVIIS